jgi:hypothetical protein
LLIEGTNKMNAQDGKMSDANRTATLLINNKQTQMPVRSGSIGPDVVDVGREVVVVGDWVATCSLGDVSSPVATSKSMAASAMAART